MTIKEKKVYYCDFCKKHTLTSNSIMGHEKHCTLNPDRVCRVCDNKDDDCPMCKFSKIRISIKNGGEIPKEPFELEKEMKKYWEEQTEKEIENEIIYG